MIRLDDTVFRDNSLIDLVVYPDMPVCSMIRELTRGHKYRIILDTQGNLFNEFNRFACNKDKLEVFDSKEHIKGFCDDEFGVSTDCNKFFDLKNQGALCDNTVEYKNDNNQLFECGIEDCNSSNKSICTDFNENIPMRHAAKHEQENIVHMTEQNHAAHMVNPRRSDSVSVNTEYTCKDITSDLNSITNIGPAYIEENDTDPVIISSLEYPDIFMDSQEDGKTEYHLIASFNGLINKMEAYRKNRDFVMILDSITFAIDSFPMETQQVINLLWSIIYDCNATVITINHYRIGKIQGNYRLVPRIGTRWEFFVTYQVLFSYKNGGIVFTTKENKGLEDC